MTPLQRAYALPPADKREILRYAAVRGNGEEFSLKVDALLSLTEPVWQGRVCFGVFPLQITGDVLDFGEFCVTSHDLSRLLAGAESAVIFAATVGLGIDRLIRKYTRLSPSDALFLQSIGTERVECLADLFSADLKKELHEKGCTLTPRFSPGYGDLPLAMQKEIFTSLSLEKTLMLTLNDSLLMSPSKSVTAIMGILPNR